MSTHFTVHRKLVRDEVPRIIEENGDTAETRALDDNQEFFVALCKKLREEARELQVASAEEQLFKLADIMEVLSAITKHLPFSDEQIHEAVAEKRKSRGGFEQRIFLEQSSHEQEPTSYQADKFERTSIEDEENTIKIMDVK